MLHEIVSNVLTDQPNDSRVAQIAQYSQQEQTSQLQGTCQTKAENPRDLNCFIHLAGMTQLL